MLLPRVERSPSSSRRSSSWQPPGAARPPPLLPTPCPGFEGWPPTDLPAPPASVRITRPPGSTVRVTNGTDAPLKIRYRVWTPGDCAAMPSLQAQLETSVIAPGKFAEWSGNDIAPATGPVIGGIEVWTHPCDETCGDPPDAFASFDVRPPSN